MRRAWLLLLWLGLLAAGTAQDAPAPAPTPPAPPAAPAQPAAQVKLEVGLGYAGKLPTVGFVPVVVDLTPLGGPWTATVTLQSEEASHLLLRLGPTELEPGQPRRLHGVVDTGALREAGELTVSVEGPAGELLGRAEVKPEGVNANLLVVLDQRGAPPADFSALRARGPRRPGQSRSEMPWTAAVMALDEDLPQSPLGWSGAGAVLLGDLDVGAWGEPEARALAAWVLRGGHLLISVGRRASALNRSLLGRRLEGALRPLRDQEPLRAAPVGESLRELATSLGLEEGARATGALAPALAVLRPEPGDEVLLQDDQGNPLALRRAHGQGLVTFIAPDLWAEPFLHQPLTGHLMERLLENGSRHWPRALVLFRELAAVRQPARVGPAFAVLIVFALVAGPGVYFVLRGKKRGIWLWLVIPLLSAAFTALVPLYRIVLRTAESTLVGVRLVEWRQGDASARETTDVLLFSGSLDEKRLELPGQDAVAFAVIPPRRMQGGVPQLGQVLGSGPGSVGFGLKIALWGARYVSFESTGPVPPLQGELLLHGGRGALATLRVASWQGEQPLEHACVVYRGPHGSVFVHELGRELPPGGPPLEEQTEPVLASGYGSGKDLESLILDRVISAACAERVEERGTAFLLGSIDGGPRLRALPNVTIRQLPTLFLTEIPVRYRDAVPAGLLATRAETSTVADVSSTSLERELLTEVLLPPESAGRELKQLHLRLAAPRPAALVRLELEAWRPDRGEWERVPLDADEGEGRGPSGRELALRLVSPPAAGHVDPALWVERLEAGAGARLRFRQRFQRPRAEPDEAHAVELSAGVDWVTGR